MKKLIFLLVIASGMLFGTGAQAQSYAGGFTGASITPSIDTFTSTGTHTYASQVVKGNKSVVASQVNVARVSGTITGYIQHEASIDGHYYKVVATDTIPSTASGNVVVPYIYVFPSNSQTCNEYQYYFENVVLTGTGNTSVQPWLLYRDASR